jgi:UDP-N-acetylglucosamine 2-epimerase (non-hydrolysing)
MQNKVLIILGTRPEIIRLSCIIKKIEKYFLTVVVNTNQNFDKNLNKVFFKQLALKKPKYNLLKKKYNNSIGFIANCMEQIDKILEYEKPNAVLVLGDTNSALSLFSAKKRKIPTFHIEAGNRCYDQRVPEEINRVLIDNIADINMVYSDVAKNNLIKENFDLDKIFKVGSPLFEVFERYRDDIEKSDILKKLKLKKDQYILVSCHREENVDSKDNLNSIFIALNKISKKLNKKIIFSTHPRTKIKIKNIQKKLLNKIIFLKPFGYFDYIKLQLNAKITISDSGSIVEESNILNFPAINLRETTERQEGMEKGFAMISSLNAEEIIKSIEIVLKRFSSNPEPDILSDYSESNVSDKVINIIQSYIPYINRKTWFNHQ